MMVQMQLMPEHTYETIFAIPEQDLPDFAACKTLLEFSSEVRIRLDHGQPLPVAKQYLHRYWEGQLPVAALLLDFCELSQVRLILKQLCYLAFVSLGLTLLWVSREAILCVSLILMVRGFPFRLVLLWTIDGSHGVFDRAVFGFPFLSLP